MAQTKAEISSPATIGLNPVGILLAIRAAELIFEIVNRNCKDRKCVNAQTKTGSMSEDGSTLLITP